jgi:hypothetical protein
MIKHKKVFIFGCTLLAGMLASPASAQFAIRNGDASIKVGMLGQFWGDWTQDSTAGPQGYQQNLYLRRVRFIMGGDVGDDISFFFETDDPKLGITPKSLGSGFIVQDAFVEWKADQRFIVSGGLMLVPFSRQTLQSPSSYYTLDVSPITTVANTATQSSVLRDAGFQAKGYFLKDKLQYRMGLFDGERDSNGHNSLRTTGYLQYDFFSPEKVYVFTGTALGKQKILAVDGGIDRQGSYRAYSANLAAALPVRGGDEIGGQFQYIYYNGEQKFLTIPEQNDYLLEAAYYSHRAKVQPFAKYESQNFATDQNRAKDIDRYGAGANYYIRGQNLKWTAQYLKALPRNSPLKPSNEFSVQLQFFYY